jgi:hypothetical protein
MLVLRLAEHPTGQAQDSGQRRRHAAGAVRQLRSR